MEIVPRSPSAGDIAVTLKNIVVLSVIYSEIANQ